MNIAEHLMDSEDLKNQMARGAMSVHIHDDETLDFILDKVPQHEDCDCMACRPWTT